MFSSSALAVVAIVSVFGVGMCKITTVTFPNYEELLGEFKVGDLGCNGASPESPDEIGVTFELFTDGTQGEFLDWTNYQSVLKSKFNHNLRTKFIIHGWKDKMSGQIWTDMRDALLNLAEPLNVICVDWSPGADRMWYMTSRDNTRVVGRIVGKLIHMLVRDAGARYEDMHVIGHSLGAHIAGYAGEECGGLIGRISGLDPAGPLFEHTERACKLDETDAVFVDSMHTDGELIGGGGAGLMERCATHDWYPFGGKDQPDCKSFFGMFDVACDHIMAVTYYTASINGKSFTGSKFAHSVQDLLKNPMTCADGAQDCPQMGYFDSDDPHYSDECYLMETRM